MDTIKDAVNEFMRSLKNKKTQEFIKDPEVLLKKLLTRREIKHIKFKYFRKGILGLIVDSSSWIYQLNLQKEGLIKKFTKDFIGLKDIRFHLGEVE